MKNRPSSELQNKWYHTMESMTELILENQKATMAFAQWLTRNKDDAQDLVQEASCKALTNRDKFKKWTNFKAWFFMIIKNIFINNYRKKQKIKEKTDHSAKVYQLLSNNVKVSVENPAHVNIQKSIIEAAIDELDEKLRLPFILNLKGYKYQKIAELLNAPIWTIKSRIHFARNKLKETLWEEYPNR